MIWYPSKTYNGLKWVRKYATLHPHLNNNNANNDAVESGKELMMMQERVKANQTRMQLRVHHTMDFTNQKMISYTI